MLRPRSAVGLALLATLLTTAPYVVATTLAKPGTQFSGFLLNPLDGFSYLAKMRQGAVSPLEFTLPYAAQPGPGALLFVYHLALGRLAAASRIQPILIYHAARIIGTLAMYAGAWALFRRTLADRTALRAAFLLAVFGSGLGWLGIPFGVLPNDLQVPEAIPFLSAYANAHFPLSSALLLLAITLIGTGDCLPHFRLPLAYAAGLGLALIQPFATLPVATATGAWILWEARRAAARRTTIERLSALLCLAAGSAPVLVYDLLTTRVHPVLSEWASQNVTPTAGLLETALGYGLVLLLALAGVLNRSAFRTAERRLLVWWAAVGLVLLFAPVALQRRLALGLFFPLAGLAGIGLTNLPGGRRRQALALAAVLALSAPSHLIVIGAGLRSVASGAAELVLSDTERRAYGWIAGNLEPGSLILAGPRSGNRLPAFSDARVVYGHPFETPDAEQSERLVGLLYQSSGSPAAGLRALAQLGIDYVLYGPEEQQLGQPSWLSELEPVVTEQRFAIYRVPKK